jgi:hypothetical protein
VQQAAVGGDVAASGGEEVLVEGVVPAESEVAGVVGVQGGRDGGASQAAGGAEEAEGLVVDGDLERGVHQL